MPHRIADRVLETCSAPGASAFALVGEVLGFRRFNAIPSIAVNDTVPYFAESVDSNGVPSGGWEVGVGTYSAANTLTRTLVLASSNSGAAVNFTGTTYVLCGSPADRSVYLDDQQYIPLPGITAAPTAPASGGKLGIRRFANRPTLCYVREGELPRPVMEPLYGSRVPVIVTLASGTTAPAVLGGTLNTAATMSFQFTATSSNRYTSTPRKRYATSTANTATGCRQAYTQFYRGSAAGYGGFFFAARVGVADNKLADLFVGMCASTTALGGNASALVNCIGIGYDVGDATTGNWFLIRNDGAGVATKVNLGATNAARAANLGFDVYIYNPPNSGTFYVQIFNVNTGAEVINTSYNTDVPAADTGLAWKAEVRNDGVATQCSIEHNHIYVEPLS